MRKQMVDVSISWNDADGSYDCFVGEGRRIKWLDDTDIENIIGARVMRQFMNGRGDFRADLMIISEYFAKQSETAQRIIESHRKVFADSRAAAT